MFTIKSLIHALSDADTIRFQGKHYETNETVYTADLWDLKDSNRLTDLASKKGIQIRFEDEIITDDNGNVHELNPGYHGQIATYQIIRDSIWSQDEALESSESYIEALLELEPEERATRWLNEAQLTELGFARFDYDAETGFHAGQTDTPQGVLDRFRAANPDTEYETVFRIDDVGQFDARYSLWFRAKES